MIDQRRVGATLGHRLEGNDDDVVVADRESVLDPPVQKGRRIVQHRCAIIEPGPLGRMGEAVNTSSGESARELSLGEVQEVDRHCFR